MKVGGCELYLHSSWFGDIFYRRVGWQNAIRQSFCGFQREGGTGRAFHCGPLHVLWSAKA